MALDHVVPQNDAEFPPPCCVWRCIPADDADWCCCCCGCCSSWAETTGDIDDDSVDAAVSASSREKQLLLLRLLFFFRATIIINRYKLFFYSSILLAFTSAVASGSGLDIICNDCPTTLLQTFIKIKAAPHFSPSSPSSLLRMVLRNEVPINGYQYIISIQVGRKKKLSTSARVNETLAQQRSSLLLSFNIYLFFFFSNFFFACIFFVSIIYSGSLHE